MASAKKRVEMVMASKQKMQSTPHVQINTHVDDPQKSLEELFTAGMRTHEQKKHYERKSKHSMPLSFNQRPVSIKSRGSSAGHSREGSSDDGIGSSGRQTLSPSSVSSNNLGGPYHAPIHTRQGSAPALINYGGGGGSNVDHHSTRQMPLPAQVPSKSLSVMAMSEASDTFVAPAHRTAKSCDLEVDPNRHLAMSYTPDGQPYYFDNTSKMTYWSDPRAKSQSLDPIAIGGMSESTVLQPQSIPPQNDPKDGLGPLPEGWMKNYDQNGDPYFIDHINQTTTWYDPRIPRHLQEEAITQRHALGRQNNQDIKRAAPYDSTQDTSSSLVQQLQMERKDMQERQQQLCREGLIEPQWRSAQQYQSPVSPMQQSQISHASAYPQYCNQTQQPLRQDLLPNYYAHDRNTSNDSAVDNTMDIDYMTTSAMPLQPMQNSHHIDPSLFRDLNAQDLNPRDFDQYLHLNDTRSQAMAKQYM
ncbi:hypothetical protein AB6A40_005676 [Gnathostoma spinigerum]|uniref:WW domain-containing protein n=1 Tax=Gnathostoma spinigerum TaxID=75299 RepID=A0ABD6EQY2_9BILA